MSRLIRTELLKLRTTRSFLLTFAGVPVMAGLVVLAVFGAAGRQGNDPLGPDSLAQVLGAPASITTTLALILGVVGLAGEYRHKTITTTLLATPRRGRVVVAKVVAHALAGTAVAMVTLAATAAVAVPWLVQADVPVDVGDKVARVAGGLVLATALHGALGVAVGALIRNQTVAVAVAFGWLLKVEGAVAGLFRSETLADWLPFATGRAIVPAGPGARSLWAAAAVLALYVVALATAGTRLVVDRDIT
jgi:ABC-2 type transport system permease protein